jgi:hypothetical protein
LSVTIGGFPVSRRRGGIVIGWAGGGFPELIEVNEDAAWPDAVGDVSYGECRQKHAEQSRQDDIPGQPEETADASGNNESGEAGSRCVGRMRSKSDEALRGAPEPAFKAFVNHNC